MDSDLPADCVKAPKLKNRQTSPPPRRLLADTVGGCEGGRGGHRRVTHIPAWVGSGHGSNLEEPGQKITSLLPVKRPFKKA